MEKENIVSNVTLTHKKRVKTALQQVKDLDLDYSDTTFTQIIYKHCLHHLPSSEKPKLNSGCIQKHNQLVNKLLGIDFK